jgi:ribosome biogenesis protein ENP2
MALKLSHANNVSIYHCTAGRSLPQWEEAVSRKEVSGSLRYNEEYRRRLELIQDFEFKASSGRIHLSDDRQQLAVSGMYAPSVKVFQLEQLAMKFERHLVSAR